MARETDSVVGKVQELREVETEFEIQRSYIQARETKSVVEKVKNSEKLKQFEIQESDIRQEKLSMWWIKLRTQRSWKIVKFK